MNKDFWERIARLEELAGKASQEIQNDKSWGAIEQLANQYYTSANPAMILDMIAEMLRLEKEADWLAEKARKCSFAYRNRSCHHLCVGNCSICLYENRIVTAQDFREAARKAVLEADNA